MAALLVALSVMAVLMTAVMPVWHHIAQREREEEWVFRGRQYARAILLFQRKAGPGVLPPTVDILVEQHFLRKKYTDPITGKDFDLVYSSQGAAQTPGQTPGQTRPGPQTPGAQGATGASSSSTGRSGGFTAPAFTAPAFSSAATPGGRGGIMGVVSSSKAESIRVIDGRSHYNEIPFLFSAISAAPGAANTANPGSNGNTPGGARGNSNGRGANQGNAPMGSAPPPGGGFSAPTFSTPPFGSGNQSPQSLPPRYPNGQPVRP